MVKVVGFGDLPDEVVVLRSIGQTYTCTEKRAHLTVVADRGALAFVKLDKGFFPDGNACDYSVSENEGEKGHTANGVLVELKGRHREDAITQFQRTLNQLKTRAIKVEYMNVAIVSSGAAIPSANRQKLTLKIQRMGLRLHCLSAGAKTSFSKLMNSRK